MCYKGISSIGKKIKKEKRDLGKGAGRFAIFNTIRVGRWVSLGR